MRDVITAAATPVGAVINAAGFEVFEVVGRRIVESVKLRIERTTAVVTGLR